MGEGAAQVEFVGRVVAAGVGVASGSSLLFEWGGRTFLMAVSCFDVTEVDGE